MEELISIVSSADVQTGVADKLQAHKYPVQRHRAISVWIRNNQGEVLLQKRSKSKIIGADWWANTVCGNVWNDESYEACALRRLHVELGLQCTEADLQKGARFEYRAYCNETYGEHEVDQIFFIENVAVQPIPNPAEVSEIAWVDWEELRSRVLFLVSEQGYYSAEASLAASWNELAENMQPLEVTVGTYQLTLAPWTVMMITGDLVSFRE